MSQRTIDLLNRWVAETVRPVPEGDLEKEARRLATEFTAFAADAGVNLENLETEIGAASRDLHDRRPERRNRGKQRSGRNPDPIRRS